MGILDGYNYALLKSGKGVDSRSLLLTPTFFSMYVAYSSAPYQSYFSIVFPFSGAAYTVTAGQELAVIQAALQNRLADVDLSGVAVRVGLPDVARLVSPAVGWIMLIYGSGQSYIAMDEPGIIRSMALSTAGIHVKLECNEYRVCMGYDGWKGGTSEGQYAP